MGSVPLAPRARLRWAVVRPLIARIGPATVLELGCGLGGFGTRLATRGGYTAAEPDQRSYEVARERIAPLGGTVVHGDHTQVPTKGYDLVCAFEVLEHIADDKAALTEWLALVRPGGHVLLSVPADPHRFGAHDVLVGHYRRYTGEQLRDRLAEAGAVDITIRHYAWPIGYLLDAARNRVSKSTVESQTTTAEERTSGSGRWFQPTSRLTGAVITAGVAPFVALQRLRPGTGPGLVALARVP
jgi:SAM-dependent methyltransferase